MYCYCTVTFATVEKPLLGEEVASIPQPGCREMGRGLGIRHEPHVCLRLPSPAFPDIN